MRSTIITNLIGLIKSPLNGFIAETGKLERVSTEINEKQVVIKLKSVDRFKVSDNQWALFRPDTETITFHCCWENAMKAAIQNTHKTRRISISPPIPCSLCGFPIKYREILRNGGGDKLSPLSYTKDHIVPLSLGGSNRRENLQPAHAVCNSIKGSAPEVTEEIRNSCRKTVLREMPINLNYSKRTLQYLTWLINEWRVRQS